MLAALIALSALSAGCDSDDPCTRDPEGCSQPAGAWPLLEGCQRQDPLDVEVGTGDKAFVSFAPGQAPALHEAIGPQAGDVRHVFLGVRIHDPDPVGGKFRVTFRAVEPDPQVPGGTRTAIQKFILSASLARAADGSLSRAGLRVFVTAAPSVVSVEVLDQCGRSGSASHAIAP